MEISHDVLIFGASCRAAAFSARSRGAASAVRRLFRRSRSRNGLPGRANRSDESRSGVSEAGRLAASLSLVLHRRIRESPATGRADRGSAPAVGGERGDPSSRAQSGMGCEVTVRTRDTRTRRSAAVPDRLPRDGTWLVKPIRSGGGREIRPLETGNDVGRNRYYFQEWIPGPSFSGLYIGNGGGSRLVGVSQQLQGVPGSPFAYRGSIGPWPIDENLSASLCRLGDVIASASGLLGWFGIDYVLCGGEPWPVEVNPRYTASVEVHELATGHSLLAEHRAACEGRETKAPPPPSPDPAPSGK